MTRREELRPQDIGEAIDAIRAHMANGVFIETIISEQLEQLQQAVLRLLDES